MGVSLCLKIFPGAAQHETGKSWCTKYLQGQDPKSLLSNGMACQIVWISIVSMASLANKNPWINTGSSSQTLQFFVIFGISCLLNYFSKTGTFKQRKKNKTIMNKTDSQQGMCFLNVYPGTQLFLVDSGTEIHKKSQSWYPLIHFENRKQEQHGNTLAKQMNYYIYKAVDQDSSRCQFLSTHRSSRCAASQRRNLSGLDPTTTSQPIPMGCFDIYSPTKMNGGFFAGKY